MRTKILGGAALPALRYCEAEGNLLFDSPIADFFEYFGQYRGRAALQRRATFATVILSEEFASRSEANPQSKDPYLACGSETSQGILHDIPGRNLRK